MKGRNGREEKRKRDRWGERKIKEDRYLADVSKDNVENKCT